MLRGLYTSASGMLSQMERQDTIANNLANVNTTGFKKDQSIIKKFPEFELYRKNDQKEITPFETNDLIQNIGKLGTGAMLIDNFTEFKQGQLQETGNELDIAINGEGFFAVERNGEIFLTRSGNFSLDIEGYLVTMNGDKVVGSLDGALGYVKADSGFDIGRNGEIVTGIVEGNVTGELNLDGLINNGILVVTPSDTTNLEKVGDNYYRINNNDTVYTPETVSINQGFLEASTVNTVREMVEMIEVSRTYEANQKVLTSQDETLEKAVNEVGSWG